MNPCWEDLLEKEMAIYSILFLPRKSHGERSLVGYSPRSCRRVGHNLSSEQHYSLGPFTFCKWQYSPYILSLSSIPLWRTFNIPLTTMYRSSSQKINKKVHTLNDRLDQIDSIDIYRLFHLKALLKRTWNILQDGSHLGSQIKPQ